MISRHSIVHLSLLKGVGPATIKRIADKCDDQLLYGAQASFFRTCGVPEAVAHQMVVGLRDMRLLQEELALIERHQVTLLMIGDAQYPEYVRELSQPPSVLYVHGAVESLQLPGCAVVGSRAMQTYGRSVVHELVPEIVACGFSVISGGARGVDAEAHRVAMNSKGITIAVVGSGLLKPYPSEHRGLYEEIIASGGAVVSPYAMRCSPVASNFPARNRIIAGLARNCLVVQAAAKGGALITALQALHEGRDVGVVPGSIFDPLSAGCHRLMREGAVPIASKEDVRSFLGCMADEVADAQGEVDQPGACSEGVAVTDEARVNVLCRQEAKTFDELCEETGFSEERLLEILWNNEVSGALEQVGGAWKTTF